MVRGLAQIITVAALNLRSVPERAGASAVAVVGIAGVVVVLVSVLSVAQGFRATLSMAGDPGTVIVMRSGSRDEMSSTLRHEEARIVKDALGILRGDSGPVASAELLEIVNLPSRTTGTDANVALRGVEPAAFGIRRGFRLVDGRPFVPGRRQLVVGRAAQRQFAGLDVGRSLSWGADAWIVVGTFEAGGGVEESEIWCDAGLLQSALRRGGTVRSVRVRLESEEAFASFKESLVRDPRLNVAVMREPDYYAEQASATARLITTVGLGIVALMTVGALFCAVNSMYTAVAARTREIATLRALGFGGGAVVASVLIESALLAIGGGVLGAGAAWVLFDGHQTSTLNWQSFSQVVFAFSVTPQLAARGLLAALVMGLAGGVLPAVRAARLPVAAALREP